MAQPKWSLSAELDSSFGYNDNLVLGHSNEQGSSFGRATAELFLMRVPHDRFDFTVFTKAEETRFISAKVVDPDTGKAVDHETDLWGYSEAGIRFNDSLKAALGLQAYYSRRIWDVSSTDVERRVAEVRGGGVGLTPSLRWTLHRNFWLEGQGGAKREVYQDGAYSSRVGEGTLRVGSTLRERIELSLSGTRRWRNYEDRMQVSAAGRDLPDTNLKMAEEEAQLRCDVKWDADERWQTTTRLSVFRYTDNGSGFFNYGETKIAQELEWNRDAWLIRIEGSAARLDFDVQTVGFGLRPPLRFEEEFSAELDIERKLSNRWTVFCRYSWERNRANEIIASYVVNEGLLGVRWSWEK